jgi:glucosamine-phosphate N-acetyltransferase
MEFRQLTIDDYAQFLPLIQEFRPTVFTEDEFKETLAQINVSGQIWVAVQDNNLIATATVLYEPKFIFNRCIYAHIEDVCVKAAYRRQRIGQRLMAHIVSEAKHRNCYKLTLDCADTNVAFYESCGLERRGNQMCQLLENL